MLIWTLKTHHDPNLGGIVVSINRASNKKAIQVPLVKKAFVEIKKPNYTSIYNR
jgi:hypothetical protein